MNSRSLSVIINILLLPISLSAQYSEVDSLLKKLEFSEKIEHAAIYNQLARLDSKNAPQKRIDYATRALELAIEYDQKEEEFHALMQTATGYAYFGDNSKALEFDLKALPVAIELNTDKFLADVYSNLGYDYNYLGNYEKSIEYNLKALEIKNKMFENGLLKNKNRISKSYNNIGSTYITLKQFDLALEYNQKALEIRTELQDSTGIARSMHNIGIVYEAKQNFENALDYYKQALSIRKKLKSKLEIAETTNNIGVIQKAMNNHQEALNNFQVALDLFNEINNKSGAVSATNNIAGIYIELKKPDKAFPYLLKGIELAEETGQKRTLSEVYINLADYYVLKNDYKNAFKTQEKFISLKDTLYTQSLIDKVSEMQAKYETERKEKEISMLTKDNEIQSLQIRKKSNQLYFSITFLVLLIIVSILFFNRYTLRQKHFKTQLEKKNLETERKLLRSQMNPHFIFNSLNSIQSYISGNDSFTAMTYLSKFAQLMRSILNNSRQSMISLSDEINTLELYMELERIRFKEKFDIQIKVSEEIVPDTIYVPPMLLQPFVENAIRHGLRHKEGKGILELDFEKQDGILKCSVLDDGIGRKKANEINRILNPEHQSLGMKVTQERLQTLQKDKNTLAGIEIRDLTNNAGEPAGTLVTALIPFEEE
ncbi:MAG: tetratricopeptide repeat protein [Bacteroidales bacterium]